MEDEMRQIEQYKKMAAENERMALVTCDEALRAMYSKFARQWHEAAPTGRCHSRFGSFQFIAVPAEP